jgi:hypothetical protein
MDWKTHSHCRRAAALLLALGLSTPGLAAETSVLTERAIEPEGTVTAGIGMQSDWRHLVETPRGAVSADLLLNAVDAQADVGGGTDATAKPAKTEDELIAEAMLNPLSYLWLMFVQNDTISYDGDLLDKLGEDPVTQNTTLIMPVLSQQLTENWKMIFRPVIPINSFETVDNFDINTGAPGFPVGVDLDRETGLGDIVLWTAFSNSYKAPNIYGFGLTAMLDTATDEKLGTGKNSAGPMALAFNINEKWVRGVVAQHWWSFSGDDEIKWDTDLGPIVAERPDVNLTDVQVVLRYRYSSLTNIGMAPNWRYNWETDQLSLPLGIGFDTLIKVGKLPTKVGVEVYYYVEQDDDFGPEWQVRFLFVPVLPSPGFSREPWFGS